MLAVCVVSVLQLNEALSSWCTVQQLGRYSISPFSSSTPSRCGAQRLTPGQRQRVHCRRTGRVLIVWWVHS
eukprot:COSAG02_NODE_8282_length_2632_cov_51.776272_3_plen_71_part_00